jgi:predicted DNA-binding ribbon-helix-helix protein
MGNLYVDTGPILYESRTRARRIHGVVATVRLENPFWTGTPARACRPRVPHGA